MKRKATTSTKQTTKKLKESVLKITEKQLNHYNEYLPIHGTSHTTPYLSLFSRMKNVTLLLVVLLSFILGSLTVTTSCLDQGVTTLELNGAFE
eukprot:gene12475-6224_t